MESSHTNAKTPDEFAALLGTAAMALVLDIESTKYAQHNPEAAEVNSWIYGERPSRSRMYAVSVPVTLALAAFAGYLKVSLSADAKNGWAWRLPLWGLSLGHSAAAAANFMNFRKDCNYSEDSTSKPHS
jgi:hypothetical protein